MVARRDDLTADVVRDLFHLDVERGALVWKNPRGRPNDVARLVGKDAGSIQSSGYIGIKIFGRLYLAHRLIWLYVTGSWPELDLDHVDCDKANNRPRNLREATRSQNIANTVVRANNSVGLKGVHLEKESGKWRAAIMLNGKTRSLGRFDTAEAAHGAYKEAAQEAYGNFARV